jgi:RNA polymerase sigma-70 factor (ECF subfamily)
LETEVRGLCDKGDHAAAATAILRGYGPELLGFLSAVHHDETQAGDAFSDLSEAIWRSLPRFAWESSVRTWAYAVARNVSRTNRRNAARRNRIVERPGDSFFQQVAQSVRTETLAFLRTEKKTRLQALRDALPQEDRMLLVLRVDRGLAWNELARILVEQQSGEETGEEADATPIDDATVVREAARLRKRFQLVKDRLRELARKEGLIE